jgi:hypothetical protein
MILKTRAGVEFEIDDEDYPLVCGFTWREQAGNGYIRTSCNKINHRPTIQVYLHRLIVGKICPYFVVDHIDGNKKNNKKSNLRVCHQRDNTRNQTTARKNNTSGFKGVTEHRRGLWISRIMVNRRNLYLGIFKTKESAALAYNNAAIKHYKEFAKLNEVSK